MCGFSACSVLCLFCMKPCHWILPALLTAPAAALPLVAALADDDAGASGTGTLIASLPSHSQNVWVQVKQSVSVEELSSGLQVDETRLARLNDVDEDHRFAGGDWLSVPRDRSTRLKGLDTLDARALRPEPPVQIASAGGVSGVVRFGDTLLKIAERYGLTLAELLRLNPGLETARLVAGSQVRLAQSAPVRTRSLFAARPTGSGGLSWPELPNFRQQPEGSRFGGRNSTAWVWPTQGVFTSGYGWRWGRMHRGIDIANSVGTPIVAAQDGRVTFSGWHDGGFGYLVEITHEDGSLTRYAHNSALLVRTGDEVQQGQAISRMGSTGRSTGPHLHFEILPPGRGAVNPLQFLPPRA
jgi:murein DD-endopeptidase MepM/ murein hydrolase activator NlpD